MNFSEFLNQAWQEHGNNPENVADRLNTGLSLIETDEQIQSLANLITHVYGEHLGLWEKGIELLEQIRRIPTINMTGESGISLVRYITSLEICSGRQKSMDDFSKSDRVRVLAMAASALSTQKRSEEAEKLFREALDNLNLITDHSDPAFRALAICGNNLACNLEEKVIRSQIEADLMILAALASRKCWEIAGTWLEVERAEYRLSQTYLKANDLTKSLEHAQSCLEIATENQAPPLELFFGYETLALAEKARGNLLGFEIAVKRLKENFECLSSEDKVWCRDSLNGILK